MKITVKGRYYFEDLRGTAQEASIIDSHRIISVNSVRIHEDPPFSCEYWTANNILLLHVDESEHERFFRLHLNISPNRHVMKLLWPRLGLNA
jgi:hypothetical protein